MRLYTGYDKREAQGWHAFLASLVAHSKDVNLSWLGSDQRDGSNAFCYERFSIMQRCCWSDWAIWMDGADMLLQAPISELWELRNPAYAIQVVKHDYKTKHPRKYVGTELETENRDYPRKNWSSVMLINCGHMAHWRGRSAIEAGDGAFLHRFGWLRDEEIGDLPVEWNWMPQELGENPGAKLLHYTAGIPGFSHYRDCEMSQPWHEAAKTLHSER